jgi:pyruvoyl-dependent arginine decarboxylase (PvlArgDC)
VGCVGWELPWEAGAVLAVVMARRDREPGEIRSAANGGMAPPQRSFSRDGPIFDSRHYFGAGL